VGEGVVPLGKAWTEVSGRGGDCQVGGGVAFWGRIVGRGRRIEGIQDTHQETGVNCPVGEGVALSGGEGGWEGGGGMWRGPGRGKPGGVRELALIVASCSWWGWW